MLHLFVLIDSESDGQEMFDNEGVNEGGLRSNMHELMSLDEWFLKYWVVW